MESTGNLHALDKEAAAELGTLRKQVGVLHSVIERRVQVSLILILFRIDWGKKNNKATDGISKTFVKVAWRSTGVKGFRQSPQRSSPSFFSRIKGAANPRTHGLQA